MPFCSPCVAARQPGQGNDGHDTHRQSRQPGHTTGADHDAVDRLRGSSHRRFVPSVVRQQLVCAALFWFDDNTVPSLVVMEQFSLLTRNKLDAWTEPTSDCEIGVTVSDQGI